MHLGITAFLLLQTFKGVLLCSALGGSRGSGSECMIKDLLDYVHRRNGLFLFIIIIIIIFWSMQVLVSGVLVFRISYHDSRCEIVLKRDKNMSIVFFILISRDLYQKLMNTN